MSDFFIKNAYIRDKIEKAYFDQPSKIEKPEKKGAKIEKLPPILDDQEDTSSMFSEEGEDTEDEMSKTTLSEDDSDLDIFEPAPYVFLDPKDGILERDFGLCIGNKDITKKYTVYLCGYRVNEEGILPFLQYHMYLDNELFTFPSFTFHCVSHIQVDEDEERTPEQVFFQNECMKRVLELVDIPPQQSIDHLYKGFIEIDTTENTVLVFFDLQNVDLKTSTHVRRVWATVDEIIHRQQILGYAIRDTLIGAFYKTPALYQLHNRKGVLLETPTILYACTLQGGQYVNEYMEREEPIDGDVEEEMSKMERSEFSIVQDRSPHPTLGDFFIFSTSPLRYDQPVFRIQRYVGFLFQPKYILRVLSSIVLPPPPNKYALGAVIPNLVKSATAPVQEEGQEKGQEEVDPSTSPTSTFASTLEDLEKDLQYQKEINVDELATLVDIDCTCVYFHEMVGDKHTPFWCIKSRLHFTKV